MSIFKKITDYINHFLFKDKKVLTIRVYDKTISIMYYDGKETKDNRIICKNVGYNIETKQDPDNEDYLIHIEMYGVTSSELQRGEY
ncbi:MAG: hypothetical protein WC877_00690 [Dehalococcoidales bacterium]|jgi:hypothetical protein